MAIMGRPRKEVDQSITWKKHPEYPNYMVGSCGEIYSLKTKKFLAKTTTRAGYYEVKLSKHSIAKTRLLHREVALTFLGKSKLTVNHKDAVKKNNNLDNLEYLTQAENMEHAKRMQLHESGVNRYNAKLKIEDVFNILDQKGQKSTAQLGLEFGIDQSTIVRIHQGKRYKKEYKLWLDQRKK